MRKKRIFMICCVLLIFAGAVLTAVGIAFGGGIYGIRLTGDGISVSAPALLEIEEQDAFTIKELKLETFDGITVSIQEADIHIVPSDHYGVSYQTRTGMAPVCEVKDGQLMVAQKKEKKIVLMSFGTDITVQNNKKQEVTVYVPKDVKLSEIHLTSDTGDIVCGQVQAEVCNIQAEYGDVSLQGIQAGAMDIRLNSGDLEMRQISGDSCNIKSEYGAALLQNVTFTGDMSLKFNSGDVTCLTVSAENISVKSEYGNIDAQRLQVQDFTMDLDCGNCTLSSALFDTAEIRSEYGDVRIGCAEPLDKYSYNLSVEYGDISVNGIKMGDAYRSLDSSLDRQFQIKADSGDIEIWEE